MSSTVSSSYVSHCLCRVHRIQGTTISITYRTNGVKVVTSNKKKFWGSQFFLKSFFWLSATAYRVHIQTFPTKKSFPNAKKVLKKFLYALHHLIPPMLKAQLFTLWMRKPFGESPSKNFFRSCFFGKNFSKNIFFSMSLPLLCLSYI